MLIPWLLPGFLLLFLNDLSSWPDIAHLCLLKEGLAHCLSFICFKTKAWRVVVTRVKKQTTFKASPLKHTLADRTGHLLLYSHNLAVPPGVKSPLASLQLDPTEAELSLRRRSFRDQPLGPFNTCRLPAQGHPDYLTACPVCKAVYFLIVKPIASCFLQLSGRNEKNKSGV